jgi:hypothetical protein
VDITLDAVTKEVADEYRPRLREAKRITDTRYTSTLYPLKSANCVMYLNTKAKESMKMWRFQRWPVPTL